ncbi:two component system sensor histidine kinase [Desulfosarcina variabilis str. Montpellier]|uniref:PAS domain S-box protein n=1 Tax=Desulfosarcina variabilis TaxID=2300 RepID=UPI003AFAB664
METFRLADLIDLAAVQKMADAHYQAAGMPIGIIDAVDDSILVSVGWQDICFKFHRVNPQTLIRCQESDRTIKAHMRDGHAYHYKCKNGLWDIGVPIIVSGRHLATMFLGQFFYQGETPDREFFIRQARKFGFDIDDYLAALDRVPVFTRDKVEDILKYNQALAGFITSLAENSLSKRKADEAVLRQQYFLRKAQEIGRIGTWELDINTHEFKWTDETYNIFGIPINARITYETFLIGIHPDDRNDVGKNLKALLEGKPFDIEHRLIVDGKVKWVRQKAESFKKDDGCTRIGVTQDITTQKQAETALIESRALLQSVIDCADTAIYVKDESGRYILSNRYHAGLFDRTPDDVVGRRDVDFDVLRPHAQEYKNNDDHVWRENRAVEFEETLSRKDGDYTYLSCKYPLHNAKGNIFAVCGISTDITQRKRIEEELERRVKERTARLAESEAKFRGLVENTSDIPFSIDAGGRLSYLGPQAKHYGFDPKALQGRKFFEFIMPADRENAVAVFDQSLQKVETAPVEFRIQSPNGNIIWFEGRSLPQCNDAGKVTGITGALRDVTERKQIEKVLKESEERYRNLFEAESGPILVFETQGHRFVDVNPAAEKQYGYTREEFLGMTYWDITCEPKASKAVIQRALKETLREAIPVRWHRKKDGSIFPVEISPSKFTLEGRTVLGGIMRDITTRMEEQKQRDEHQKRLRQLAAKLATAQDEEQQRIAEGLHDDVAQDLALCSLKLALAERELDPAKARLIRDEIGELIHTTAEKIRSLSFELSSSSLFRIGFKEAIVELCNSMAKRYDVCFTVKGSDHARILDDTTAAVLFKAVRELLFNVVKHAGTKEATVFIDCKNNILKIEVEDRGKGFHHRVDEDLINMGKGMGLFGIKERLTDLGGELDIDSTPSDRTRVTLKVPVGKFFQSSNH